METTKISKDRIQELIDKYSEDTFIDLLDLAHYTIDSAEDIVNGLEELQTLQKENKTLNRTIDMQHETTISDLKLIGKLQQQNKNLLEEMHSLSTALFDSDLSTGELETIRRKHISFMKEYNNKTT